MRNCPCPGTIDHDSIANERDSLSVSLPENVFGSPEKESYDNISSSSKALNIQAFVFKPKVVEKILPVNPGSASKLAQDSLSGSKVPSVPASKSGSRTRTKHEAKSKVVSSTSMSKRTSKSKSSKRSFVREDALLKQGYPVEIAKRISGPQREYQNSVRLEKLKNFISGVRREIFPLPDQLLWIFVNFSNIRV